MTEQPTQSDASEPARDSARAEPGAADRPGGRRRGRRGRGTMRRRPDQPCLNCGDTTYGNYCPNCGQAKREVAVSVVALVMDVLEDQFILHRALPRTIGNLIFKPGKLTAEYVNGRIVSYIAPFRLYLVTSVLFFLLLSFVGLRALDRVQVNSGDGAADPDSVAAGLERGVGALAAIDTSAMPPEARAQIAAARAAMQQQAEALDSAGIQVPSPVPVPPGTLQPWARGFEMNTGFGAATDSTVMRHVHERYGHLPGLLALRAFLRDYAEYLPHSVFLLLPVFAFVLKLLYIRRKRYYAEHFVFSLHVHAFVFLMFIIALLLRNWIVANVLILWSMIYIWLAMKRVYGQGWFRTSVKYWVLGFTYFILLTFSLAAAGFATLLLG